MVSGGQNASPAAGLSSLSQQTNMSATFEPGCPLCKLEKITTWYYEDDEFVILDCESCGVPMGVIKGHGVEISAKEAYNRMIAKLADTADCFFGKGNWHLDTVERTIRDHRHAHARGSGWW